MVLRQSDQEHELISDLEHLRQRRDPTRRLDASSEPTFWILNLPTTMQNNRLFVPSMAVTTYWCRIPSTLLAAKEHLFQGICYTTLAYL
jgi:hypothetical protein